MVICLQRGVDILHMVYLCHGHPIVSASETPEWLSFWYQPNQVVLEKRSLNDCMGECVKSSNSFEF